VGSYVTDKSVIFTCIINNINLYSPASGSKERNIQTYKYGEKATKEKKQRKNSEQVYATCHYVDTCDNTILSTLLY